MTTVRIDGLACVEFNDRALCYVLEGSAPASRYEALRVWIPAAQLRPGSTAITPGDRGSVVVPEWVVEASATLRQWLGRGWRP